MSGKYETKEYGKYTLFIGEKGFYLEDANGKLILDASELLEGFWAIEAEITKDRDFYMEINTSQNYRNFGIGQVKDEN